MKIKLPSLRAGAPNKPPKLKLKASVASRRRGNVAPVIEDDDDYFDEPEPNMKLSHAFVVVLVLHVIAVAGVFAFNTIKTKQDSVLAATKPDAVTASVPEAGIAEPDAPMSQPAIKESPVAASVPGKHVMMAGETLTRIASQYGVTVAALQEVNHIEDPTKIRIGTTLTIPTPGEAPTPKTSAPAPVASAPAQPKPEPAAPAKAPEAAGTVYEVVKGDNPVTIAKKFNVSQAELMELNDIDDPRKLQIGQKLKIPAN